MTDLMSFTGWLLSVQTLKRALNPDLGNLIFEGEERLRYIEINLNSNLRSNFISRIYIFTL